MGRQHYASEERYTVPEGAYTERVTVRSYEARRDGLVHAGTIMRYLEHLATRASADLGFDHQWYEQHASAWVVREMKLWMGRYPTLDSSLVLATWLSETRRVQALREYAAWDEQTGVLAARGQARWAYIDRASGQLLRIPDALHNRFTIVGSPFTAQRYERQIAAATSEREDGSRDDNRVLPAPLKVDSPLTIRARDYEVDTQQHVNNCVYADWLEEAFRLHAQTDAYHVGHHNLAPAHTSASRVRYLHIEYLRPVLAGEEVAIRTDLRTGLRRSLIARQSINTVDSMGSATPAVRAQSLYLVLPRHRRQ